MVGADQNGRADQLVGTCEQALSQHWVVPGTMVNSLHVRNTSNNLYSFMVTTIITSLITYMSLITSVNMPHQHPLVGHES